MTDITTPIIDEFKNYKREFIQINSITLMLIHIFYKDVSHCIEDTELAENNEYHKTIHSMPEEAAKQLFKQFEGRECIDFIEALRNECNKYLNEYGTERNKD